MCHLYNCYCAEFVCHLYFLYKLIDKPEKVFILDFYSLVFKHPCNLIFFFLYPSFPGEEFILPERLLQEPPWRSASTNTASSFLWSKVCPSSDAVLQVFSALANVHHNWKVEHLKRGYFITSTLKMKFQHYFSRYFLHLCFPVGLLWALLYQ